MMGPSKILTVSYGTFSCTLEGFDDPFSTMRSIAEYFRDLAAEDRYFGAEPPTPDAEMLHRIAEREVQQRVEARVGDNSVVLRQLDADQPQDTRPEQQKPTSRVNEAPAKAAAAIAASSAPAAPASEAARPATDRADVSEPAQAAEPAPAEPEYAEPEYTEAETISADSAESVAEKLARIRAATADASAPADQPDDYVEDEYADQAFTTAPISTVFDDISETASDEDGSEAHLTETLDEPVDTGPQEQGEAEVSQAPAHMDDEGPALETAEEPQPENQAPEEQPEFGETATRDDMSAYQDGPDLSEAQDQPAEQETEESAPAETEQGAADFMAPAETAPQDADGDDWSDADVADPDAPAIARVVKMRREDFENAVESGSLQEYKQDDQAQSDSDADEPDLAAISEALSQPDGDDTATQEADTGLSPEDEAELMATLEAVQRKAEAETRAEKEGRALLENQDIEENAESVSRILDVTNSEMEETEGTRRRSAIAHLKAAVAATRADKLLSRIRKDDEAKEMDQYRKDLAQVVRPKRPAEDSTRKKRRVAPLVLVSEQRVDEAEASAQPPASDGAAVRPRRISRDNLALAEDEANQGDGPNDNIFVEPESFAKFASELGAHDLPDLLEAAAAYMSFVEGHDHFSRPQIMKAVTAMKNDEEYSREEILRSFGLLLRRGKIKKIQRGQFTIAESTRFKPQQLAVGE